MSVAMLSLELIAPEIGLFLFFDILCFQWGERNNVTGQIMGDPIRFPEGMPAFIQKLHDMGFKFGLCK